VPAFRWHQFLERLKIVSRAIDASSGCSCATPRKPMGTSRNGQSLLDEFLHCPAEQTQIDVSVGSHSGAVRVGAALPGQSADDLTV